LFLNPTLRKSVVDQKGLKAVVTAMKNHKKNESVQLSGCRVLSRLILPDEASPTTWAKAATDSGCIQLVITAMENHPNHAKIQVCGCMFFWRLSNAHDDYRNMVLDAEGLVPVVQALRVHKDVAEIKFAARKAFDAVSP
jgi:hypothetical protein